VEWFIRERLQTKTPLDRKDRGAFSGRGQAQLRSARATGSFIAALLFVLSVVAGAGVVMPPAGGVAMGVVCVLGVAAGEVDVAGASVVLVCANTSVALPTTARAASDEVMKLDVFMVDP
jgi:hypothetical protein